MTLDTPTADAAPTRRSSRALPAPAAVEESGVLTRAELRRRRAAAEAAQTSSDAGVADEADAEAAAAATAGAERVAEPSVVEAVAADLTAAFLVAPVGGALDETARRPAPRETDVVDEFDFAAKLFSFTGETPVQRRVEDAAPTAAPTAPASAHVARPPRGKVIVQRLAAASLSISAMTAVGMLAVGTTTPAAALAPASVGTATAPADASSATASGATGQIQAFVATGANDAAALNRPDNYDVASMAQIAAESGVTIFAGTWINDPTSAIQWPFPVGVPVSAAYGSASYLSEFSSAHRGVDLTPGAGAAVHVVAAGTVRIATEAGGDYGVTVLVDHVIDGQLVSTRYAHMQYGSLKVKPGDTVAAGDVLGAVGQTGKVTGPHLHLEVLLNGTTDTDPMVWLEQRVGRTRATG